MKDLFKGCWTIPNLLSLIRILLIPVFGYIPSFWSLVPAGKYDAAESFMLKDAGSDLKTTVARYQMVVANSKTNMAIAQTFGANYYNVSNYNRYIAPVTPSANWNSDGVIETINTSSFAKVANIGETLDVTYGGNFPTVSLGFSIPKASLYTLYV